MVCFSNGTSSSRNFAGTSGTVFSGIFNGLLSLGQVLCSDLQHSLHIHAVRTADNVMRADPPAFPFFVVAPVGVGLHTLNTLDYPILYLTHA